MPVTTALISAGAQATSAVINNTVNNLFQQGVRKAQISKIDAEKAAIEAQTKLNLLSNQQKAALARELQNAKTETERLQIISNQLSAMGVKTVESIAQGYTAIQVQQLKNQSAQTITLAIIVIGGSVLFITAIYFLKKKT
jgi:hypothetical protein